VSILNFDKNNTPNTSTGNVRFISPILLSKHLPAYLNPGPKSSYTMTTGSVSEKPMPNWAVVAAYAGGLHSLTKSLALDLKPIRVNSVSPGAVDTELWSGMSAEQKEGMFQHIRSSNLTGRVGQIDDLAEQYLALMRDYNVTGSVVKSDGGSLVV
jgi:NAD(P)-dependent dehydrogenase (short-subunit alcohol dehydrogenase family)